MAALQDDLAAEKACSDALQKVLDEEREANELRQAVADTRAAGLQRVVDSERAASAQGTRDSEARIVAMQDSLAAVQARAAGLQKLFDYAQAEIAAFAENVSSEQVRSGQGIKRCFAQ